MENSCISLSNFLPLWQKLTLLTDLVGNSLSRSSNLIWKSSFISVASRRKYRWQLTTDNWQELLKNPQALSANRALNSDLTAILSIQNSFVEYLQNNSFDNFVNSSLPKLLQDWLTALAQFNRQISANNYFLPRQQELNELSSAILTHLLFVDHTAIAEILIEQHLENTFNSVFQLLKIAPSLNSALEEIFNHQKDFQSLTTLLQPYFPAITDQIALKIKQEHYYRKLNKPAQQWLNDHQIDLFNSAGHQLKIEARMQGYPNAVLYVIDLLNHAVIYNDQKTLAKLAAKLAPADQEVTKLTPAVAA